MGVAAKDLLVRKEITFEELKDKVLVVDAFNILYQFITTIRQADGSPLTNAAGMVTSHLNGLFYRTTKLMEQGLKLAFVFDGKAPELKQKERERRAKIKSDAKAKHEQAVQEEDVEAMKKYASRIAKLTPEMIAEAKELLNALGIPVIQAPSEGEAQASYMVTKGDAYAIVSQDADCLMFGAKRVIRNLSVSGKRKKPGTYEFVKVLPEVLDLSDNLNTLQLTLDQLIVLFMLIGTDFNPGGIKGIGPKKAQKLMKDDPDFDTLFTDLKWGEFFDVSWQEVFDCIKTIPTTDDYKMEWGAIDDDAVHGILVTKFGFNPERVDTVLKRLKKKLGASADKQQKGLGDFF